MFTKNMNQNVQSSTIHHSIQLEITQVLINSIVQSSAKIFSNQPDNKYLDSAGQEAKSSYNCITLFVVPGNGTVTESYINSRFRYFLPLERASHRCITGAWCVLVKCHYGHTFKFHIIFMCHEILFF